MQNRYRLFRRGNGVYYALEPASQRQTSLHTRSHAEATRLIAAKNQASDIPQLNRAMAKVYASAASPELMERTWQEVMDAYARKSVVTARSAAFVAGPSWRALMAGFAGQPRNPAAIFGNTK